MSSITRPNLELLLQNARGGAGEALGELLQAFRNYLKILASTQIEPKLRARVCPSDVVQETMLEAHRDFGQFQGKSEAEFVGWLRRILVNNLARLIEQHLLADKRDVRREISLDQIRETVDRSNARLASLLVDNATSPSAHCQQQEQTLRLAECLAKLPPDYRDILVMRHLENLPFADIATRLDRTAGACRMLWLRALEQLREIMKNEGGI